MPRALDLAPDLRNLRKIPEQEKKLLSAAEAGFRIA
jgi:hypothetical protein